MNNSKELKKNKNIKRKRKDQLLKEILDYDLVISNDPILSNQLNNLLMQQYKKERVFTPKQILRQFHPNNYDKKYEILNEIKTKENISYKQLDKLYYDYVKYKIEKEQNITIEWLNKFDKVKSIYSVKPEEINDILNKLEIDNRKIAILDYEMFNEFDRLFCKEEYDKIELFYNSKMKLENLYLFENEYTLIDYLVDSINYNIINKKISEKDITIFISNTSIYKSILQYKFKQKNINVTDKQYDPRKNQVSLLLELIKTILFIDNLRIIDNVQIMQYLRIRYSNKKLNSYIKEIDDDTIKKYYNLIISLKDKNISSLLELLKFDSNELKIILSNANLLDVKINYNNYNEIRYYFKRIFEFDISKNSGISIISSDSRILTINREYAFFVGMDTNLDYDYDNFSRLIQSAKANSFLFSREENTIKTFPNINFSKFLNKDIKVYEDMDEINCISYNILQRNNEMISNEKYKTDKIVKDNKNNKDNGKDKNDNNIDVSKRKLKDDNIDSSDINIKLSASKLTNYVQCPKKFFFSTIIINPETYEMLRGTYIHNFCECYLNNKKLVISKIDELIDYVVEKLKIYEKKNKELIKSEINYYFNLLIKYLDQIELSNVSNNINHKIDKTKRNELAIFLNIKLNLTNAEYIFKINNIIGYIDLIINENTIVDYKTKNVPQNLAYTIHPLHMQDDCDYQPLVYLYYLDSINKTQENSKFIYLYLKNDISKKMYNKDNSVDKITIEYLDEYFMDYIKDNNQIKNEFYSQFGDILDFEEFYTKLKTILIDNKLKTFLIKKNLLDIYIKKEFKLRQNKLLNFIKKIRIGNKDKYYYYKEDMEFLKQKKKEIEKNIIYDLKFGFKANPINKRNCLKCPYKIYCTGIYNE